MVNYRENVYARRGLDGRSHIPALPFWLAIIRVVQIIFSFLVLVLCASGSSVFAGVTGRFGESWFPGYGMAFFTFAWTVLFMLYILSTPFIFPKLYHSYAHLVLEFLTTVFWLTTFALLADECKLWAMAQDESHGHNKYTTASAVSMAATGLATIVWLLFMISFGSVVFLWNKHRTESRFGRTDIETKLNNNAEIQHFQQPQSAY